MKASELKVGDIVCVAKPLSKAVKLKVTKVGTKYVTLECLPGAFFKFVGGPPRLFLNDELPARIRLASGVIPYKVIGEWDSPESKTFRMERGEQE